MEQENLTRTVGFRCTEQQFLHLSTLALTNSTPRNRVQVAEVIRKLIDRDIEESKSEQRDAA